MWILYAIYPAATVVFAAVQIAATKQGRTSRRVWGIILAWAIFFNIGISGLMAFYAHAFRAAQTAGFIGWPAGNPFQFEVACANLALGVLGVLSLWMSSGFRLATILGFSVFLLGAAVGHIDQLVKLGNQAPGNAGAPLYADIIAPPLLLTLWAVHFVLSRRAREHKLLEACEHQLEQGGGHGEHSKA